MSGGYHRTKMRTLSAQWNQQPIPGLRSNGNLAAYQSHTPTYDDRFCGLNARSGRYLFPGGRENCSYHG